MLQTVDVENPTPIVDMITQESNNLIKTCFHHPNLPNASPPVACSFSLTCFVYCILASHQCSDLSTGSVFLVC